MVGFLLGLALLSSGQNRSVDQPADLPPPRGRLFISPMGEPFRGPDPVDQWFRGADTNHDGVLTLDEFIADAARFFAVLDRRKDGEIDPDDIEYYETVLAPEIRTGDSGGGAGGAPRSGNGGGGRRGGGHRGGGGGGGFGKEASGGGGADHSTNAPRYSDTKRGAARFSFFDYPEPVTAADSNFNRGVDPKEFRDAAIERFGMLDKRHDGRITRDELPKLSAPSHGNFRGHGGARHGGSGPPDGARTPADADPEG